MPRIGSERSTAFYQILGVVYLFTLYPVVLLIGLIGGLIYMLSDVISKLFFNKSVSGTSVSNYEMRIFRWPISQLEWIATGDGAFPWTP